jgi:hypothetical protein
LVPEPNSLKRASPLGETMLRNMDEDDTTLWFDDKSNNNNNEVSSKMRSSTDAKLEDLMKRLEKVTIKNKS